MWILRKPAYDVRRGPHRAPTLRGSHWCRRTRRLSPIVVVAFVELSLNVEVALSELANALVEGVDVDGSAEPYSRLAGTG